MGNLGPGAGWRGGEESRALGSYSAPWPPLGAGPEGVLGALCEGAGPPDQPWGAGVLWEGVAPPRQSPSPRRHWGFLESGGGRQWGLVRGSGSLITPRSLGSLCGLPPLAGLASGEMERGEVLRPSTEPAWLLLS